MFAASYIRKHKQTVCMTTPPAEVATKTTPEAKEKETLFMKKTEEHIDKTVETMVEAAVDAELFVAAENASQEVREEMVVPDEEWLAAMGERDFEWDDEWEMELEEYEEEYAQWYEKEYEEEEHEAGADYVPNMFSPPRVVGGELGGPPGPPGPPTGSTVPFLAASLPLGLFLVSDKEKMTEMKVELEETKEMLEKSKEKLEETKEKLEETKEKLEEAEVAKKKRQKEHLLLLNKN